MNLESYFKQYEALLRQADEAFAKVRDQHPESVRCAIGCADCCHALFDLSLIEALYVKNKFDEHFEGKIRQELIERANVADRAVYRIKRQAFQGQQAGKQESEILEELSTRRVRCPLLNADDRCAMYAERPITCRIYGIPTIIGGKAHTCGASGFEQGKAYPTVKLDQILRKLYEISFHLSQEIHTRYPQLAEMLIPLSMALLTDFTPEYLGVRQAEQVKSDS